MGGRAAWPRRTRAGRRGAGARRDPEDPRLVGDGQAAVGRGHARAGVPLKVVLLGSAPLLMQQGLTESLAGRFEVLRLPHWSFAEMRAAFGFSLDQYLFFGGYPGAAPLVARARSAGRATSLDSPDRDDDLARRPAADARGQAGAAAAAVRARLPLLGAGAVVHEDARPAAGRRQHRRRSRTTSICSAGAGMVTGLPKFAGDSRPPARLEPQAAGAEHRADDARSRACRSTRRAPTASSGAAWWSRPSARTSPTPPPAASASSSTGATATARWTSSSGPGGACHGHRGEERPRARDAFPGMAAFAEAFGPARALLVGGDGIPVEEFLSRPARHWVLE